MKLFDFTDFQFQVTFPFGNITKNYYKLSKLYVKTLTYEKIPSIFGFLNFIKIVASKTKPKNIVRTSLIFGVYGAKTN